MNKKVVIIGGVAGGASAAARLRRLDENTKIVMFEKGDYISFANCGLPYHIGGIIPERKQLLVQTVEGMKSRFNIDIRIKSEVTKIDRENKEVEVIDYLNGKTYRESYDILLLSPGAAPLKPPIKGIESPSILTLRNIPDMDRIIDLIKERGTGHCAIVGGGFIGVEMAENLRHLNWQVTLIERQEQVMPNLDKDMAAFVHQEIRKHNIELILSDSVVAFEEKNTGISVSLDSGRTVDTDLVILAIGVKPDNKLAADAGLEVGSTGGIKVNEYLQTSDPSILAVGDAIETTDFINGKNTWVPLAGPANRQGRLAADNIGGKKAAYDGIQGTAIAKVFDLVCASIGKNERALQKDGIEYLTSITHSNSHAGYYPGAFPVTIKILYAKNGKLLGAQAVGYQGVDKRIDVLATSIHFGANVDDLSKLELAYAPPFSSAKDPVNIAGYVASNIIAGDIKIVYWHEIKKLLTENAFIIDVREPIERDAGFIEGSVNIPLNQLRNRLGELPRDRKIIIYCQVGLRAYIGARILMQHGFGEVYNLSGGYKTYKVVTEDTDKNTNKFISDVQNVKEQVAATAKASDENRYFKLDACGLQCPGPIMQLYQKMQSIPEGDYLEISVTDPGFINDVQAWCQRTGNTLVSSEKTANCFKAVIRKGFANESPINRDSGQETNQNKTMVVFSGDLDKAIASFIIANGAAAMGRKVTMFFTFWGLNILRKPEPVNAAKGFLDKMFGIMMPRGSKKLGLSKMNMAGLGGPMIRYVMKKKNVSSLEELIGQAKLAGIRMVACQMSMDVMGIKPEELIDGIEIGGVASYLAAAEESNVNLFI